METIEPIDVNGSLEWLMKKRDTMMKELNEKSQLNLDLDKNVLCILSRSRGYMDSFSLSLSPSDPNHIIIKDELEKASYHLEKALDLFLLDKFEKLKIRKMELLKEDEEKYEDTLNTKDEE